MQKSWTAIGGVVNAELREEQVPIVAGLPAVVATMTDPWHAAYGSVKSLRAGPGNQIARNRWLAQVGAPRACPGDGEA
ncbi:hypothetical protein [Streptomyces sp. NPDC048266]|uniref:hypothetical protein n=1 Tax=Streptomyces sp. NPDC048266 TaxID=3155787 RepID=UPI0033CF676F